MHWFVPTFLICSFTFWNNMKPYVPFLNRYLQNEKNFTNDQLLSEVYPYAVYSELIFIIPVFILADFVRHRPVIFLAAAASLITWTLLIWGEGLLQMQIMECLYGLFAACSTVAYFAYIYTAIDEVHYKHVTGYVRAAYLSGKCFAYTLAQVLVSGAHVEYVVLCYLTFASASVVLTLSVCLFFVPLSRPFPSRTPMRSAGAPLLEQSCNQRASSNVFLQHMQTLCQMFKENYSVSFILKWSLWWAFATCIDNRVGNTIQNIYSDINNTVPKSSLKLYNGIVDAVKTLVGAGCALSLRYLPVDWTIVGETVLGAVSLVDCFLLVAIGYTSTLAVAYVLYVIYYLLYQILITIVTYNLARQVEHASYGLVFGWNNFLAVLFQTIMTVAVTDKVGFHLTIKDQYLVYGIYHALLGIVFFAWALRTIRLRGCKAFLAAWTDRVDAPPVDQKTQADNEDAVTVTAGNLPAGETYDVDISTKL